MSASLRQEGYRIVTAAGGAEGLCLAEEARLDVILLDLLMPGMDGRFLSPSQTRSASATRVRCSRCGLDKLRCSSKIKLTRWR